MNVISSHSTQIKELENQLAECKDRIRHAMTAEGKWLLKQQKERIKEQMGQILKAPQPALVATKGNQEPLSKPVQSVTTIANSDSSAMQHLFHWVDFYLRASADSKNQN